MRLFGLFAVRRPLIRTFSNLSRCILSKSKSLIVVVMWSFVRRHVVMLFAYEPATGYEPARAYGTSGPKPAIGYEPAFRGYVRCSFLPTHRECSRRSPGTCGRAPATPVRCTACAPIQNNNFNKKLKENATCSLLAASVGPPSYLRVEHRLPPSRCLWRTAYVLES